MKSAFPGTLSRSVVNLLFVFIWVPAANAQLDAEANKPYRLDIVLSIGKHRLLTDDFRDQVKRELEEGLQAAYGDLAHVKVVEKHPRLDDARKLGLQKTLDDWRDLNPEGTKSHFVLIDYLDGQYEVQARQQDGLTGQASPVVRRDRTADRTFVSRLATLLIDRDFGPVDIADIKNLKSIPVTLKGGKLGADLGRRVRKGDVFQVIPVTTGAPQARKLGYTVLHVIEPPDAEGVCQCHHYGTTLKPPVRGGFRCLRIHTEKGPLRLLVLEAAKTANAAATPVSSLGVTARRHGFENAGFQITKSTERDGTFTTETNDGGVFDRLAFVVLNLKPQEARVPIPIVDDQPSLIRIPPQNQDVRRLLAIKKELWDSSCYESGSAQQELVNELNKMQSKPTLRGTALDKARQGLTASRESQAELDKERASLLKEGDKVGLKLDMTFGDGWIKFLDKGHVQLETYIKDQEGLDKDEKDPKRIEFNALVSQAKLEEGRAEFGKALDLFKKASTSPFADEGLKKYAEQLAAKWEPKGGEPHRIARAYIYDSFPLVNLLKDKDALTQAETAFDVCRGQTDTLTPQKLLQEILKHGGKLKEQEKELKPDINEEDRVQVEAIAKLAVDLKKLGTKVQAYLEENARK